VHTALAGCFEEVEQIKVNARRRIEEGEGRRRNAEQLRGPRVRVSCGQRGGTPETWGRIVRGGSGGLLSAHGRAGPGVVGRGDDRLRDGGPRGRASVSHGELLAEIRPGGRESAGRSGEVCTSTGPTEIVALRGGPLRRPAPDDQPGWPLKISRQVVPYGAPSIPASSRLPSNRFHWRMPRKKMRRRLPITILPPIETHDQRTGNGLALVNLGVGNRYIAANTPMIRSASRSPAIPRRFA
jgi:hypothetical protein